MIRVLLFHSLKSSCSCPKSWHHLRCWRMAVSGRSLACAEPTPEGEQLLDPFHVYGRVKRIRGKPVQSFMGSDTFLRIAQAEKEHLIEVNIGVSSSPDESASCEKEIVEGLYAHDKRVARAGSCIFRILGGTPTLKSGYARPLTMSHVWAQYLSILCLLAVERLHAQMPGH